MSDSIILSDIAISVGMGLDRLLAERLTPEEVERVISNCHCAGPPADDLDESILRKLEAMKQ